MKSRRMLATGISGILAMALVQGVSAAEGVSENKVPVSYDYSGTAEPVSPYYSISIPIGMVFDAKTPDNILDISVSMKPAQGETEIQGPCGASVSVKSANGYVVALANGKDEVAYLVQYEGEKLSGKTDVSIGTLSKGIGDTDKLQLEGSAKLQGVAKKTGNHVDTLTYTITNIAVS